MSSKAIKRTQRAPLTQPIVGILFTMIALGLYLVPKYFLNSPASLRAQQSVFPNYKIDKPVLVEITYISDYIATSTDDKGQEYVYYFAQVPNYDVAIIEVSKEDSETFNTLTPPLDFIGMPVNSSEVGMSEILGEAITHYKLEDDGPIWDNTLDYFISKVEFDRYTAPNWAVIIFFGVVGIIMIVTSFFTRRSNKKLENQLVNQFQSINSIQDFIDRADYRNGTLGIYIKDSTMVTSGEIYQSIDLSKVHSMGHQLMVRRGRYNYVSFIEIVDEDGRTEMTIQGKKKDIQAALPDFYRYIAANFPNIILPDEILVAIGQPVSNEKTTPTSEPTETIVATQEVEDIEPVQDDDFVEEEVVETNDVEDSDNAGDDYVSPFANKDSDKE